MYRFMQQENSGESTIVNEPRNPYEKVMGTFDTIWRTVIHFRYGSISVHKPFHINQNQ